MHDVKKVGSGAYVPDICRWFLLSVGLGVVRSGGFFLACGNLPFRSVVFWFWNVTVIFLLSLTKSLLPWSRYPNLQGSKNTSPETPRLHGGSAKKLRKCGASFDVVPNCVRIKCNKKSPSACKLRVSSRPPFLFVCICEIRAWSVKELLRTPILSLQNARILSIA